MKNIIYTVIFILCLSNNVYSLSKNVQITNISKLCKIWGYMKYYHPDIYSGKYDWDKELFKVLPSVVNSKNTNDTENEILQWVSSYSVDEKHLTSQLDSTNIDTYIDLSWINNLSNNQLKEYLKRLHSLKREMKSFYVEYDQSLIPIFKEQEYPLFHISDINYRLLFLFKVWNVIEYFSPYKNILDSNWNSVLIKLIPNFIAVSDIDSFMKRCCYPINVLLSDNHVRIWFDKDKSPFSKVYNGFTPRLKFIENKLVVIGIDSSQSDYTNIQKGDVINKVNNKNIKYYKSKYAKEFSYASDGGLKFALYKNILKSTDSIINISFSRGNKDFETFVNIKTLENEDLYSTDKEHSHYFISNDSILYIKLEAIRGEENQDIISQIQNSRKIIVDIRNEPTGLLYDELADAITSNNQFFAMVHFPYIQFAGNYLNKIKIPTPNKNIFDGKVVVITDENALSHSEYTIMKLQKANNCITIGDNTMGVDGNARSIVLPFNLRLSFTAIGIYYPDGGETQRVGVKIDEIVKPTIRGIREGRDELLERAIELIEITKLK